MSKLLCVFALFIMLLAGCAALQPVTPLGARPSPAQLPAYEFVGRISIKQEETGNYGNIRWSKHDVNTDIIFISPLGQIVAQIHHEPAGVTLTTADQRKFQAESGEALTQQVLGYSIPVDGLNDWVLGKATDNAFAKQDFRSDGLLEKLRQNSWIVRYLEYATTNGWALPRRIVLERAGLEIRLVIDQWTFPR